MAETTLASLPGKTFGAEGSKFTQSHIDAINNAISAQNANNTSLRTDIDAAAKTATVTVSLAELLALNATPKKLLDAGGNGTVIQYLGAVIKWVRGTAAFTIGSATNLTIGYKTDASVTASVARAATGFFDQAASQISELKPLATNVDLTGVVNQGLYLSLAGADMTVGTGGSAIVKIAYRVLSGL